MKILHDFDSGSIDIIDATAVNNIQLALKQDSKAETRQWFHFRLETQEGMPHTIRIVNAGQSSFASAWHEYQVMASYDQNHWFRVKTEFKQGELVFDFVPEQKAITFAYFAPYSLERQRTFIQQTSEHPLCRHTVLAETTKGHSIDLLRIGEPTEGKQAVWLIARQHPGEAMAQWFAEGFINGLLSNSELAEALLQHAVFYVVPNMNPDGSELGNHRTNFHGLNLNRQWNNPSKQQCPEVFYVKQAMQDTGVDLLLDIHGDEEIPHTFMMAGKGRCGLAKLATQFKQDFERETADFQTQVDYDTYESPQRCCSGLEETKTSSCATNTSACGCGCGGGKSMAMATEYVAQQFGSLALVLEMPFTDHKNQPNDASGWSVTRSKQLAVDIQQPILSFLSRQG